MRPVHRVSDLPSYWMFTLIALVCASAVAGSAQRTVVQESGGGRKVELHYNAADQVTEIRTLGADAIGMSTVPEAIVARQCGLMVAAVSCITNKAGGDEKSGILVHEDVLSMGQSKKDEMAVFLKTFALFHAAAGR